MIHIIPCNDLIDHIEDTDCPCGPEVDVENDIVIHAAMDRRECFESEQSSQRGRRVRREIAR